MKKLLFVIDSLGIGGAEKSLVTLLNLLDYDRFEVDLQLFSNGGTFEQLLPKEVNLLPPLEYIRYLEKPVLLQMLHPKSFLMRMLYSLKIRNEKSGHTDKANMYWQTIGRCINNAEKKYDIAIGYGQNIPTLYVVDKVNAKKKFAWVNCVFHLEGKNLEYQRRFYSSLDGIAVVSEEALMHFKSVYPDLQDKMQCVLDLYDGNIVTRLSQLESDKPIDRSLPVFMTAGRLNKPQKGYDLALEAAKILKDRGYKFRWYAVGEGPYRADMETYIRENQLEDIFILLGSTANPYAYMRQCDIYVQTSRHEGFGLTIAEARILNRPVVCTNFEACAMQMKHEKNGLIVDINAKSIADGIECMLNDDALRNNIIEYLKKEKKGNTEEIEKFYRLIE